MPALGKHKADKASRAKRRFAGMAEHDIDVYLDKTPPREVLKDILLALCSQKGTTAPTK
jgi:hypothetical protein